MTEERAHLAVDQTGKKIIVSELALRLYDYLYPIPATAHQQERDQAAFNTYCQLRSGGLTARELRTTVLSPSF